MILFSLFQVGVVARAQSSNTFKINPDSETESARKWSGEWQFEVGGENYTQGKDESTVAAAFFKASFQYHFTSWLRASAKPRVDFYSSRVQQRYESDDYRSGLRVSEAFIGAKPIEQIEIRGGAISQDYLNSPMLISKRRAFPGAQVVGEYEFKNAGVKAELVAQHTIPTSSSLNTDRQDKEELPTFDVQSVHFSGKSFESFEWRGYAGHYNFSNLPSKIAAESKLVGNSVDGYSPADSRFKTGFDGFFGGAELCACFADWSIVPVVEIQRIFNARAGSGLGNAQMWGVGPRINIGDKVLDLRYRNFFIEKDATVAAYNTGSLGTNLMGDDVEFRLDFPAQKFAIYGEWTGAVPIRNNQYQQTMSKFYLGVETKYAPF